MMLQCTLNCYVFCGLFPLSLSHSFPVYGLREGMKDKNRKTEMNTFLFQREALANGISNVRALIELAILKRLGQAKRCC